MGWFKDFIFGKEKHVEYNMGYAVATLRLKDNRRVKVTRKADLFYPYEDEGPYYSNPEQLLKTYFLNCKTFLKTDDGEIIPVHQIDKVDIESFPKIETFTF
jgi:hypothetical protein